MLAAASGGEVPEPLDWSQLPPLPEPLGVAGAFAGVAGGALLLAGGANFPDKMPWEGGEKVWHDAIYVLEQPAGSWRKAGRLPRPQAYGVSVSYGDSVVCVGGSDATRHYADTFRLWLRNGVPVVESLPALPMALASMSGALVNEMLCIAGGAEVPGERWATNRFFAMDLGTKHPVWRELDPVPGPGRLLAAAAAHDGAFYLFGGVTIEPGAGGKTSRAYLRDAWRCRPGRRWERLADLPKPSAGAPAPAPFAKGRILLLAGDDGSLAGFKPVEKHPGFAPSILAYDPLLDRWSEGGRVWAARATAPCVQWRGMFVVLSGESRPGVRSPEVWGVQGRRAGGRP